MKEIKIWEVYVGGNFNCFYISAQTLEEAIKKVSGTITSIKLHLIANE